LQTPLPAQTRTRIVLIQSWIPPSLRGRKLSTMERAELCPLDFINPVWGMTYGTKIFGEKGILLDELHQNSPPSKAPALECTASEAPPTALKIFNCVFTNENIGREREAPAEPFRPRGRSPSLVDVPWPPGKAPQERRSPVMIDHRTTKRCLKRWAPPPVMPDFEFTCMKLQTITERK
jgi:hypothetical protein